MLAGLQHPVNARRGMHRLPDKAIHRRTVFVHRPLRQLEPPYQFPASGRILHILTLNLCAVRLDRLHNVLCIQRLAHVTDVIDGETIKSAVPQYPPIQRVPLGIDVSNVSGKRHISDQQPVQAFPAECNHPLRAQRIRIFDEQSVVDHQHQAAVLRPMHHIQKSLKIVRQRFDPAHLYVFRFVRGIPQDSALNQFYSAARTQPENAVYPMVRKPVLYQLRHRSQLAVLPVYI